MPIVLISLRLIVIGLFCVSAGSTEVELLACIFTSGIIKFFSTGVNASELAGNFFSFSSLSTGS